MSNVTFQVYPKTDLEKIMESVEESIRKNLKSYIGQGDVQVCQGEDGNLEAYIKPIVPVKHIHVNVNVKSPG